MFLMDEQLLRGLVREAGRVYSCMGMSGFESWANSKNGNEYVRQIYEVICKKNCAPSTSIFSIDSKLEEEIFKKISKNGRDN